MLIYLKKINNRHYEMCLCLGIKHYDLKIVYL